MGYWVAQTLHLCVILVSLFSFSCVGVPPGTHSSLLDWTEVDYTGLDWGDFTGLDFELGEWESFIELQLTIDNSSELCMSD